VVAPPQPVAPSNTIPAVTSQSAVPPIPSLNPTRDSGLGAPPQGLGSAPSAVGSAPQQPATPPARSESFGLRGGEEGTCAIQLAAGANVEDLERRIAQLTARGYRAFRLAQTGSRIQRLRVGYFATAIEADEVRQVMVQEFGYSEAFLVGCE
ncbi:MAG: SPOR domain-containing protein, partial [Deinococcus sp.]|nr:SPOR domain-containing protein [Deinococcus sp.]